MVKRSNPQTPEQHLIDLKILLDNFEVELIKDDLRLKVQALIPVIYSLRNLGSSLISLDLAKNARERIIQYLLKFPKTIIPGEELMVISGIDEWARRVRELRVEFGWNIISGATAKILSNNSQEYDVSQISLMRPNDYMLISSIQDRDAAHRWNIANSIRKGPESVQDKLLLYFQNNIGKQISGEELRYVAKDKIEWQRRVRELRSDKGWPIVTQNTGMPDLPVGVYVMQTDRQLPPHDRKIKDNIRAKVLERDHFSCTNPDCKWNQDMKNPADPRQNLELHHLIHHIDGGDNSASNLITLCNVCHDRVHANELEISWKIS